MSKITQNNESSTPSSPSNGSWNLFSKADGYYLQNHTGAVNILSVYGATIGVHDEGITLGTPGILNFVGDNVSVTVSGTVARVFITGTASAGGVSDGDKGDVVVSGGGTVWTIDSDAVTLDKLVNATAQYRLLGRNSSGAGDFQEITGSADVFSILGASNYAAIRVLLSLVTGTNIQPYDPDLDIWAKLTPSANGQSLVTAADYNAMKVLLGLVTGTNVQAWDVELQSLADLISGVDRLPYFSATGVFSSTAFTPFARTLLSGTSASQMQTTLSLVPGTNVQAWDTELQSLADLVSGVDRLPYFSATGVFSLTKFPAFARQLVSGTTASEVRTTIGLPYPQGMVDIVDGTTGSIDASLAKTFNLVAGGNRIIGIPTNPLSGQSIIIVHTASGADRTLTLHTGSAGGFYIPSSISITATPSGTRDYIGAQYFSGSNRWDVVAYIKGFR